MLLTLPLVLNGGLPPVDFNDEKLSKIKKSLIRKLKELDPSIRIKEGEQPKRDLSGDTYTLAEINGDKINGFINYNSAYCSPYLFGFKHPGKIGVNFDVPNFLYQNVEKALKKELRPITSWIWS